VHSLYCDILGLITTGVGNLVDPISLAEQLPWTLEDGSEADLAQLRADWHKLKDNASHYAKLHWRFARDATRVRLTDQAIDDLVAKKRAEFEAYLKKNHFPQWDTYPADAQLGIMSMAWACGPGFPGKFKNFARCVLASNWAAAAQLDDPSNAKSNWSGKIREAGNPGVVPRNKHNRLCFQNAALVEQLSLDPRELHWPNVATATVQDPSSDAQFEAVTNALDAQSAAQQALDHFVATERDRFLEEGPSAARDLRDWEEAEEQRDTDRAPPPEAA